MISRFRRFLPIALLALTTCGDFASTIVGKWDLVKIVGTEDQNIQMQGILSMELRADGKSHYVSCLSPVVDSLGTKLSCKPGVRLVCANGSYTLNGMSITLRQNMITATRGGTVLVDMDNNMVINGTGFLADWVKTSIFKSVDSIPTDCDMQP